jgi:hypothetical protein
MEATAPVWAGKHVVDLETDNLGLYAADPVPLRHLFCLTGPAPAASADASLTIRLSYRDETWLAALKRLPETRVLAVDDRTPLPQITLATATHSATLRHLERLCVEHGIVWLDVLKRDSLPPDFERTPSLAPIPPSQAAWLLLMHFQAGQGSWVLQRDLHNRATRLLAETARLLATARCYTLSPGRLPETLALIEAQVRA